MPNPCPRCGQPITPEPGRGWVLGVQVCHACILDLLAGWVDTDLEQDGRYSKGGLIDPHNEWNVGDTFDLGDGLPTGITTVTNTTGTDEPLARA